jgi:2-oxoglutarate ferredoxin oxidoreductase subunit delta
MGAWELPRLDKNKCAACGICVDACTQKVLELSEGKLKFVRPQNCIYCGICDERCPHGALICSYEIGWE